ncbi:hypothetical protein RhiJN_13734 [Ceratobasidium sp. AG-Ba]|nr:hypothetical protein RhiJN_13734 [Ceratobasidium sp. AG-Ba]
MMSIVDFTELIAFLLPDSGEDKQSKAACQILHVITLMHCFDQVDLDKVRYAGGKSFVKHIVRNKPLVDELARAFGIVVPMPHPEAMIMPKELHELAGRHRITIESFKGPRKNMYDVFYELRTLVTFMEVAHKIFNRSETTDLQTLERAYRGHCHPCYSKPRRTLRSLFYKTNTNSHLLGLAASELPGARPRTEIEFEPAKFPVHPRLRTVSTASAASMGPRNRSCNTSRKSRRSSAHSGHVVLVAYAVPVAVAVPTSDDPADVCTAFPPAAQKAFLTGIKGGISAL